ncbi:MAG: NAD(P)H-dependent oxidoreductase subunit E [Nocardioidaceae bacterium]
MTTFAWRNPVEELVTRGDPLPPAARHGTETYYADLHAPRGARHVRVCAGTGCLAASGGWHVTSVEQALGVRAGECSADSTVSLQEVRCLGYCYAGPAALDGDHPCTGTDLADQLTGKTPRVDPAVPVGSSGPRLLLREPPGRDAWRVWEETVTRPDSAAAVRNEVSRARLRGRGGAGFPAAAKWTAVAATGEPSFVVANGDEGDPGSFADRLLMECDPALVLEGLALAGLACGATRGYVYVRSEYPRARAALQTAVEEAYAAGHLGVDVHNSHVGFDVELVSGHGSYVAGEETSLLRSITGVRGTVHPRPPYPVQKGLFGRPTAVNNVETLAAVPGIVAEGGAVYARLGDPTETGTILVSMNERFARPGAYEVELGTPLRAIVDDLGGGLRDSARLVALQVGGPLGGFLGPDQLDVPLLESALSREGVSLGHGGIVAIDERTSREQLLAHVWRFGAAESCGACTPCREGTRRGAGDPDATTRDEAMLALMERASLCAFGRRLPVAVRTLAAIRWD